VLADAATSQVLWSRSLNTQRPMASVTKVMTALLVLETGGLNRTIRVPKAAQTYAWKYGGESAGLYPGDVLTAQQLLEALLLASGADAAYTLASVYGPGLTGFVAQLNATAVRMGMTHTHFTSPDGLPYPTEYSTYSTPSSAWPRCGTRSSGRSWTSPSTICPRDQGITSTGGTTPTA
jgi:D-alanyl-D-alanine carboxypeptidase (penicillin-binding protein 5/6)